MTFQRFNYDSQTDTFIKGKNYTPRILIPPKIGFDGAMSTAVKLVVLVPYK